MPVITHTCLPSVTGDGDDMFCLLPMRFSPDSGRFQLTACLLRSTAHSSICPVARSVATLRNTVSFQMIGVEPLNAGSGSFHATLLVGLHVVGSAGLLADAVHRRSAPMRPGFRSQGRNRGDEQS